MRRALRPSIATTRRARHDLRRRGDTRHDNRVPRQFGVRHRSLAYDRLVFGLPPIARLTTATLALRPLAFIYNRRTTGRPSDPHFPH